MLPAPSLKPLEFDLTPPEAAARCRHLPGPVFFDSALETGGAISVVAADPAEIVTGKSERDWQGLREKIASRQQGDLAGMPDGFAAGTVDYDGAFCFGFYDDLLVYRHADKSWHASGDLASRLRASAESSSPHPLRFAQQITREHFCGMVRRAKEYIAAGDIYQVNLSQKFTASWRGDAWKLYETLRQCSPAPYAAYLDLNGRAVLSSSPESFLEMSGRRIRTRPIKGTRPRRAGAMADEQSARELLSSQKEIAELVMITDLERNDLGRVCDYGSVEVVDLLKLERYEQVFHLVSTVEGRLREGLDHVTALRACFPGGSITGAPKKRAMEIIAELEPSARGLYTGAIGWFGFNGGSRFNIAIRTMLVENGLAHFHVGAGIVADSDPDAEYAETLHKAGGILLAAERLSKGATSPGR